VDKCFSSAALQKKHKHKKNGKKNGEEKIDEVSPKQQKAFNYYAGHTQSIEIIKDDCIQKVNFRVRDKVCLFCFCEVFFTFFFSSGMFFYTFIDM